MSDNKISIVIPTQLPEYIRDNPDYEKFVSFFKAYYEWMEESGNALAGSGDILTYTDIDTTSNQFLEYFYSDFLPTFPKEILADKRKIIKLAKELYKAKGTPASFKFLFRILYDSDFDYTLTKESVLKASDGVWYVAKSLKVISTDFRLRSINNYRAFGETSKALALVENVAIRNIFSEIYISNIERSFASGEYIRIIDELGQDILINGYNIRVKLVSELNTVKIDPNNQGLEYAIGDPVVIHGGLGGQPSDINAEAIVSTITSGSVQALYTLTSGYGFRDAANVIIEFSANTVRAHIGSYDPSPTSNIMATYVATDIISPKQNTTINAANYIFANTAIANANTTLANTFNYTAFYTHPVTSLIVDDGGYNISAAPTTKLYSTYDAEANTKARLIDLGILAKINIVSPGNGYVANDTIYVNGGSGSGAFATVSSVSANGMILAANFIYSSTKKFPLGGMGYHNTNLPTLYVASANGSASGAVLTVPSILSDGDSTISTVNEIGKISSITVNNTGSGYIGTPEATLRVQDMLVSNVAITNFPASGDFLYQGASANTASYFSYVHMITLVSADPIPQNSVYNIRVFNYNTIPTPGLPLKIDNKGISLIPYNHALGGIYNQYGIKTYGNGQAKATATILNGISVSDGVYLNSRGHLSGYNILQDENHNAFTYEISVAVEIEKYRDILRSLVHPAGLKMLGKYSISSNNTMNMSSNNSMEIGHPISYYTTNANTLANISTDFTQKSNNILNLKNINNANIASFIQANSTIDIIANNNISIRSTVVSVNVASNTILLKDNIWGTFSNVAMITGQSGDNKIHITYLTGTYNIINNNNYRDPVYPIKDIVTSGDTISISNNSIKTVANVDYTNNYIYLTTTLANTANSLLSVNRTYSTSNITIYSLLNNY